jgi:uncharacterized iron-regulated protein
VRGGHARRRQRARGGGIAPLTLFLAALAATLVLADHPLAGRAWDAQAGRFIEPAEVERRVAAADVALLGETHDNPVHHELQLRLLRASLERGRRPSLAMEQLDTEAQPAVDAAIAKGTDAAGIARDAKVSGWPWRLYEPLVGFALERRLPIVAVNLSRARAREAAASPLVEGAWSEARNRAQRATLVEAHCGQDGPHIDAMVRMQRARDAVMAERMAAARAPVVAIIGRGHARADLGVPLYLRASGREALSVGFVEVVEGAVEPGGYEEAAAGRHDIVWFTPRASRPDPCK